LPEEAEKPAPLIESLTGL